MLAVEVLIQVEGAMIEKYLVRWVLLARKCVVLHIIEEEYGHEYLFCCEEKHYIFFTMPLHRLLKSRHGDMLAGHWEVMTAAMSDVKTMSIACAWIQRGMSYFVRTCRSVKIMRTSTWLILKMTLVMSLAKKLTGH